MYCRLLINTQQNCTGENKWKWKVSWNVKSTCLPSVEPPVWCDRNTLFFSHAPPVLVCTDWMRSTRMQTELSTAEFRFRVHWNPFTQPLLPSHSWTSASGSHHNDTNPALICVKWDKPTCKWRDMSHVNPYLCLTEITSRMRLKSRWHWIEGVQLKWIAGDLPAYFSTCYFTQLYFNLR